MLAQPNKRREMIDVVFHRFIIVYLIGLGVGVTSDKILKVKSPGFYFCLGAVTIILGIKISLIY